AITLALLGGVGEPPAAVLRGDPESEPVGVDLLTHTYGSLLLHGSDTHGHVAGALVDLEGTTLCSRPEPLRAQPLRAEGGGADELTLIEALPCLIGRTAPVGGRGLDELGDGLTVGLRPEPQSVQGRARPLATNQVHSAASLHGRHAETPHLR